MKSLKSLLFLSIGGVFLIVALLNYFLPELLLKRELVKASYNLTNYIENIQKRINHFSSFLVTLNTIQGAAELDGLTKVLSSHSGFQKNQAESTWGFASQIASYNPQIAFIQLTKKGGNTVVITPEDGILYSPLWTHLEKEMLLIKIPEKNELYIAILDTSIPNDGTFTSYLLFNEKNLKTISSDQSLLNLYDTSVKEKLPFAMNQFHPIPEDQFHSFIHDSTSITVNDSIEKIFKSLLMDEYQWIEKINLIQILAPWQEKNALASPSGVLKVDSSFKNGVSLFANEVFSTTPVIKDLSVENDKDIPFILLREGINEKDLDISRIFSFHNNDEFLGCLGFSLSAMVKKIAEIIQKPVVAVQDGGVSIGFYPDGKQFEPEKTQFPFNEITAKMLTWQENQYSPFAIDLTLLKLVILTPEEQATELMEFLTKVRKNVASKVSLTLMAAAFASLIIALLLLENISKKITRPITLLSVASEELGKGKYEGLVLPQLGKRQDEVAVLTHSFKNLVIALQDRDKIRGVLNKVVSKEISEAILKTNVELGGEERTLTMLFSDIRGFTHLSENLKPQILIGMLNDYMTRMCRIIDETHGVVDKFVGDEIMALYGAPLFFDNHAIKAIDAALFMIQHLREWNIDLKKDQKLIFEIGIGIHTGIVCVGNMGAENRLNYTVIGANVNLASRLCSKAAPMQILISEETWKLPGIKERYHCQALPPITLKGIDHPVQVYEVLGKI